MNVESVLKYVLVLFCAFIVTYLLTPIVRKGAIHFKVVDQPGGRRLHQGVIPRAGGIAVFLGFHAAMAFIFFTPWLPFAGTLDVLWWWKFLGCSSLILTLGLIDDVRDIPAVVKLGTQTLIALLAIALGMRMGNLLGFELPILLDWLFSLMWILLLVNAFNLVDGLDGLASGLAIVAALGLAGSLFFRRAPGDVLVLLALVGACLAFLRYNFHPASIFLGDSGSMFLGFTLAAISLSTSSKGPTMAMIGVPLFAMGVPLIDTLLAVWRRSMRKVANGNAAKVSDADSDHLHHRLLGRGYSQKQVALTLYAIGSLSALLGMLLLIYRSMAQGITLLAFILIVYGVVRHLAWIELRESGAAVLRGFSKPSQRNIGVVAYPILDICSLVISLVLATFFCRWFLDVPESFRRMWFYTGGLNIALPLIALFGFRAYIRIWSLARISEYMLMGFVAVGGIGMAFAVHSMLGHGSALYTLQAVFHAGLSFIFIVGNRAFFRVVQDMMAYNSRKESAGQQSAKRILLLGSSLEAAAFLKSQRNDGMNDAELGTILGIVDETPLLRGRYVHGYKILGGVSELSAILSEQEVDEIIGVQKWEAEVFAEVAQLLREKGISYCEWINRVEVIDLQSA